MDEQVAGANTFRTRRVETTATGVGWAVRDGATVAVGTVVRVADAEGAAVGVPEGVATSVDAGRAVIVAIGVVPGNMVEVGPFVAVAEGIAVASTPTCVANEGAVADGVADSTLA